MARPNGSYEALISSKTFRDDLAGLNAHLLEALRLFKAPRRLNGNLFYAHKQRDFDSAPLHPEMEEKRRRLMEIARRGKSLLEIGVNGGHSLLPAKHANPDLQCTGIDICRQIDPSWGRVDIYTPAAMAWLKERFPGDFTFLVGDSRLKAPEFAVTHEGPPIDILHVDGAKETYLRDIVNLLPVLHDKSLIVVDDTQLRVVRRTVRRLVAAGLARRHPDYPDDGTEKYQHIVLHPVDERPGAGA